MTRLGIVLGVLLVAVGALAEEKSIHWLRQNELANEQLILYGESGDLYYLVLQLPLPSGDAGVERVIGRYYIERGKIAFYPFRTTCPKHEPKVQAFWYDADMEFGRLSLGHKGGYTVFLWMLDAPALEDPDATRKIQLLKNVAPLMDRIVDRIRSDASTRLGCVDPVKGKFSPHEEVETVVGKKIKADLAKAAARNAAPSPAPETSATSPTP